MDSLVNPAYSRVRARICQGHLSPLAPQQFLPGWSRRDPLADDANFGHAPRVSTYRRKGQSQNIIPHLGPVSREQSRFGQNTAPEMQPLAAHASGDPDRASTKWPSTSPHICYCNCFKLPYVVVVVKCKLTGSKKSK